MRISLMIYLCLFVTSIMAQEMDLNSIVFESFQTTQQEVYLKEVSVLEMERILAENDLIKIEEYSDREYILYKSKSTSFFIHAHVDYYGGAVFKSLSDYLLYHKHFERKKVKKESKAFVNKEGRIISYDYYNDNDSGFNNLIFSDDKGLSIASDKEGRIIIKNENPTSFISFCNLYDFNDYLSTLDKPVFLGVNNYGENLFKYKNKIVYDQLVIFLGLKKEDLDFSISSLKKIDNHLDKMVFNDFIFFTIYLGLTIYFGECLIKDDPDKYNWILVDEGENVWTPAINTKEHNLNVFIHMYIYESFKSEYYILPNLHLTMNLVTGNIIESR